jgi:hypothetical protein
VRTIIDDASIYDQLKLLARFVRLAGYGGLMVCLDELVNLYKLSNTQARNANYEQILRILNDSLQGSAEGLGIVLAEHRSFSDTRRGLYSYAALQSRLAENTFAKAGMVDYFGPVLRLASLTPEDFYVLLWKLRHVYASGDEAKYLLPDEAIPAFMSHCAGGWERLTFARRGRRSRRSSTCWRCSSRTVLPTGESSLITLKWNRTAVVRRMWP